MDRTMNDKKPFFSFNSETENMKQNKFDKKTDPITHASQFQNVITFENVMRRFDMGNSHFAYALNNPIL